MIRMKHTKAEAITEKDPEKIAAYIFKQNRQILTYVDQQKWYQWMMNEWMNMNKRSIINWELTIKLA